jgi:FERM central domain
MMAPLSTRSRRRSELRSDDCGTTLFPPIPIPSSDKTSRSLRPKNDCDRTCLYLLLLLPFLFPFVCRAVSGNNFYRIVFKVHMYFEPPQEDKSAHHELYVQAVYDVVSARYPCSEKDCLSLGALQLQAEYGNAGLPDATLKEKLNRYMPAKYCEEKGDKPVKVDALIAELKKIHKTHEGKTKAAAEAEYLSHVKEWQVYGSSFFFVEPQMSADLPDEVFLAVNPKGILIINPDTKEVLATHPYSEVPTWGHSGSSFVLHIGNLIKQTKLYFSTEQGKEINDLVRAYVNHLCVTS